MNLTDQMMHLRKDLESLRGKRFELVNHIKNDVYNLRTEVLEMRKGFQSQQKLTAEQDRAKRQNFVFGLKESVEKFRHELSIDLLGARNAWFFTNDKKEVKLMKHHEEEPVKQPHVEPVKQPHVEPVKQPHVEPVKQPDEEPVKQHDVEPVKQPHLEPVKQHDVEHVKQPHVEPVKNHGAEHVKHHGAEHSKHHSGEHDLHARKDPKKLK